MANPEYQESLDRLDVLSIILYRSGISLLALSFGLIGISYLSLANQIKLPIIPLQTHQIFLAISAALCAANIHVYNKVVRIIISWSSWIGLVCLLLHPNEMMWLSFGFFAITTTGIALKESFCFRVFGLKLIPILMIGAVLALYQSWSNVAGICLLSSSLIYLSLAVAKWRMPLHFDIGIKANYEI